MTPTMNCAKCGARFPWKRNKKYCDSDCRVEAHREKECTEDALTWNSCPLIGLHQDANTINLSAREHDELIIRSNAPEGAVCYRAGCYNAGKELAPGSRVRWFPGPLLRRVSYCHLSPFAEPDIPFPGEYLVAYFNNDAQRIRIVKLVLKTCGYNLRWSFGDLKLDIEGDKTRLM